MKLKTHNQCRVAVRKGLPVILMYLWNPLERIMLPCERSFSSCLDHVEHRPSSIDLASYKVSSIGAITDLNSGKTGNYLPVGEGSETESGGQESVKVA